MAKMNRSKLATGQFSRKRTFTVMDNDDIFNIKITLRKRNKMDLEDQEEQQEQYADLNTNILTIQKQLELLVC